MNMSFYVGALGAKNCTKKLAVVSNNLANVNTAGYKPKSANFTELVNYNLNASPTSDTDLRAGVGMRVQNTNTCFSISALRQTNSELDYAILRDNAFFMIQDPVTGDITYTRNGQFRRGQFNDEYYLMTEAGKYVLDQNQEPMLADTPDLEEMREAMEEGYEPEYDEIDEDDDDRPRIGLYTFENPSRLINIGDSEFVPSDAGVEPILMKHAGLVSHSLESSGTDMVKEMVKLIECQRSYSYAARMITTSDEIAGTVNSLRG